MNPTINKKITQIAKFITKPELVLFFIGISIFISIMHFHINDYERVDHFTQEKYDRLEGKSDYFSEANHGGAATIAYSINKLTGLDYYFSRIAFAILFSGLALILFYKLTKSYLLTTMLLIYPPFLMDSYISETSIVMSIILGTLLLYKYKYKKLAFLLAIPMAFFRHEGLALYGVILLYEFFNEKHYANFYKMFNYIKQNLFEIGSILAGLATYLYLQYYFFGHPLANFILNTTLTIELNFPWYYDLIRWGLILLMIITSILLYEKSKLLFWINTTLASAYIIIGVLGFDYTFYAIMKYYGWMILFTIISIGHWAGIIKKDLMK